LKIAECPQSDLLKWLEQCNLYAACLAFFQPQFAEVLDPGLVSIADVGVVLKQPVIPKQVIRWI
jgi:hypothetical protein